MMAAVQFCNLADAATPRPGPGSGHLLRALLALLLGASAFSTRGDASLELAGSAEVASDGIFLDQVVRGETGRVRLADAPAFGQRLVLPRARVAELLAAAVPDLAGAEWAGAEQIVVTRRRRLLAEPEIKSMLAEQLQREHARARGEVEVRFTRSWTPVVVPDEPLTLVLADLPLSGLSPNFIVRFELRTERELAGSWQMPVQAKLWKEVWVAASALVRGQALSEAGLALERRDMLTLRDAQSGPLSAAGGFEVVMNVQEGAPLQAHYLRLRPLVRRGQVVDAILRDSGLNVVLKVELLENGAAGQIVRVRNVQSRREFRGKVENEQTIEAIL